MKWTSYLAQAAVTTMALGIAACADDGSSMNGGACLAELELDCTPTYPPTFDEIYARRLQRTCAANGGLCHGPEGAQGGLGFADADAAYQALLGDRAGHPLVIPGDPECSVLIQRLESEDPNFVMPSRGPRLSAGQRCAIRQWVANGAER